MVFQINASYMIKLHWFSPSTGFKIRRLRPGLKLRAFFICDFKTAPLAAAVFGKFSCFWHSPKGSSMIEAM